ncbi:hypothetical protein NEOLEDRAFT_1182123 [Neolentinus lepideus HHB14362 ss-1]|uniref:Uncharacterized protein n=1 Tax=Neolentinus lepideus HHB14362 ss-1 TaxID=1314782 RepID=A0A165PE39_9AGAM|nr:hypothetical protein NEOLEDRAFT_1182123 [Neolentinus lepideus HHB14362 ss-1]
MSHQHLRLNLGTGAQVPPQRLRSLSVPLAPSTLDASDVTLTHFQAHMWEFQQGLARGRPDFNLNEAPGPPPPVTPVNPLVANLWTIAAASTWAQNQHDDGKKAVVLPPIIPGHKADALALIVPPKVEDAIREGKYVPYSALTTSAQKAASCGETMWQIDTSMGQFISKGLNRAGEYAIKIAE